LLCEEGVAIWHLRILISFKEIYKKN
jgi:hypothetical protein